MKTGSPYPPQRSRGPTRPRLWQPVNPLVIPGWVLAVDVVLVVAACILTFVIKVPFVFVPAVVILVLFTAVATAAQRRRFLRLLEEHQGLICLRCHYPLSGLPSPGVCPECREPFEAGSLARIWGIWLQGIPRPGYGRWTEEQQIVLPTTKTARSGDRDTHGQN